MFTSVVAELLHHQFLVMLLPGLGNLGKLYLDDDRGTTGPLTPNPAWICSLLRARGRLLSVEGSLRNQRGRTAHRMEIDPRYVDVIVRRWEELRGQTAVLEKSEPPVQEYSPTVLAEALAL